jgi:transcriptional regulator with XRE-family HTH domain
MHPRPGVTPMAIRTGFGRLCRETRLLLDVSQADVAARSGVTRGHIGRIERGEANPTLALVERIAEALGLELTLVGRPPVFIGEPRPRDIVHARCSAYVSRRLRGRGLDIAREVEVVHGRSHGWIDLLAFDRRTQTLYLIEIKTRLQDLGSLERQFSWYERSAWDVAEGLGWRPRRLRSWLLVLDSVEVQGVLRSERRFFDEAFPRRAREMTLDLAGTTPDADARRGVALIDPADRGRAWLLRTKADGRRSPSPYLDYADAAGRPAR